MKNTVFHTILCCAVLSNSATSFSTSRSTSGYRPNTAQFPCSTMSRLCPSPSSILAHENNEDAQLPSSSVFDRPVLAGLDLASLVIFAAVGKASHSADGSLDFAAAAVTAAPFVVAWFATSPLTGVYKALEKDTSNPDSSPWDVPLASLGQTFKGWALAVPLGCVGRGLIKGYVPPLPFVIVTLIATLVLLGGARAIYAVIAD